MPKKISILSHWYISILIIILLFCSENVQSANVLKYISNAQGLSNSSVNCIFEDSQHMLWIGTWDGLNIYNGKEIKSYRYSRNDQHSISNNVVRQIIEQDARYMWVATDYGINRWDKITQQFTRYYLGTENEVPRQEKSFIIGLTPNGTIIAYVREEGFFVFDNDKQEFTPIDLQFADYIKDFFVSSNNQIYFLFQDGDVASTQAGNLKNNLTIHNLTSVNINSPTDKIVRIKEGIVAIQKNQLSIIGNDNKMLTINDLGINKTISQVLKKGTSLYISFLEGGCIIYDMQTNTYTNIDEINNHTSIFTMHMGSQDILWIGSDGQGVLQLYDYNYPFQTIYSDNPVRAFAQMDKNTILVGTKGGGVKRFDKQKNTLSDYLDMKSGLISNSVYAFYKNKENDIFIGTEGEGINILYGKTQRVEKLHIPSRYPTFKAVYRIYSTHNDSLLWIGTSGHGLIKLELKNVGGKYEVKSMEQYTSNNHMRFLKNDVVYAITSDNKNNLWFGTRGGGLNKLDISRNTIERVEDIDSNILLTNNDVLSIYNDSEKLWIGTSYGLNKLTFDAQKKATMQQYTEHEGLNNNTIHGIAKDAAGNIWISSNMGLSVIDGQEKVENFTMNIGLQNDEFSDGAYFTDDSQLIYFGGVSGFNYFDAQEIKKRDFEAKLILSSFKIYNTNQNIAQRIVNNSLDLSYDERYVTFDFIAKDFINNQNCEYSFRLLPENDEWTAMGATSNIVFSQLAWGKYTLEVRATNGDKVWNDEVYRLNIKVGPPWWLSVPAIAAYLLLTIVLIYIIQSTIKNRIRMSRRLLIEQIEMQHQQKAHEAKLNFFTNVAHEFFTPLTLIYGPAQHLLEETEPDAYSKRYLQIIKNNAERMQKLISELMEFRKAKTGYTPLHPEKIDINLLINYVSDNYSDILQENKIDYKVNARNLSTLYTDRDSLEKIFINLVSNAFKYTPSNGYIHIDIFQDEENDNALNLTITNSGKGLTEIQMEEIFDKHKIFDAPRIKGAVSTGVGLNLSKSLVEILRGKIDVSSKVGEYVEFKLWIPALEPGIVNIVQEEKEMQPSAKRQLLKEKKQRDITILIVEDERNIRELLKDILSSTYTIVEAGDGQQALDIVEQNHPDIIISDILMPNLDGIGMIDKLKSDPKTRYIPIISISARTAVEDQVNAYKHGADLYITKPFHPKHILSTIENLIDSREFLKDYYHSAISSITIKDGLEIHKDDETLIHNIATFIHNNIEDETLDPAAIAEYMNISKATLYRKIKDITDSTPSEFVRTIRLEHASKLLITTKMTVSEIMFKCGFANKSYFYREFGKQYGVSPMKFRENGE